MNWLSVFSKKVDEQKRAVKKAGPKIVARLIDGRPVPKPNKTAPFRKGIF